MPTSNHFFELSYRSGNGLILLFKLQLLWLIIVLQGGIIFGIFPATATVMQFFLATWTTNEAPPMLRLWFIRTAKQNYWMVNCLGYFHSGLLLFLLIDLKISRELIQNAFLHFILIVLLISVILAVFYLFPTLLRYHLSFIHYFLRAFLLIVISPFQTLAMIISLFLTSVLLIYLPILFFFVSIPMLLFPISYFAYQGMEKAESLVDAK